MYFKRYIQDNFSKLCRDDGKVHVDFKYKTYDNRILKYKGELDNIGEFTGHSIVTYPSGKIISAQLMLIIKNEKS